MSDPSLCRLDRIGKSQFGHRDAAFTVGELVLTVDGEASVTAAAELVAAHEARSLKALLPTERERVIKLPRSVWSVWSRRLR